MTVTHEVTNQARPLVGHNLFAGNQALRDALAFNAPGWTPARCTRWVSRSAGPRCRSTRAWPTSTCRNCTATTASATASTRSSSTPATTR